jgi:hypothetical protein
LNECPKIGKQKTFFTKVLFFFRHCSNLDGIDDIAEDITDCSSSRARIDNHHNGNQNKNKRILYEALAFIFRSELHDFSLLVGSDYN